MKSILGVMELMLYPFYIFPALLGWVVGSFVGAPILGDKWLDFLISILDPAEGIRDLM